MKGDERGLIWKSIRWPNGTTYEGLARDNACEVRGVISYPNGDRYEGDWDSNQRNGWGTHVWSTTGSIYRGEWQNDAMEGCGVLLHRRADGSIVAEEGLFMNDEFIGPVMACPVTAARSAATEADRAAQMARAFVLPNPKLSSLFMLGKARRKSQPLGCI